MSDGVWLAKSVELPPNGLGGHDLIIDGQVFPWHITDDLTIEGTNGEQDLVILRIGIYVDTRENGVPLKALWEEKS
jgi:hypothetical protein